MILDARIGFERKQFASQINNVPEHVKKWFNESFNGTENDDFNEGLLSGFSSALAIIQQYDPSNAQSIIGCVVSLLANRI